MAWCAKTDLSLEIVPATLTAGRLRALTASPGASEFGTRKKPTRAAPACPTSLAAAQNAALLLRFTWPPQVNEAPAGSDVEAGICCRSNIYPVETESPLPMDVGSMLLA